MIKKLFTMEQGLADKLAKAAQRYETSQSRVVSAALTVYLMLDTFAPTGMKKVNDLNNQVTIDEVLKETQRIITRKDS